MNNSMRSGASPGRKRSWRKIFSVLSATAIVAAGVHVVQSGYLPSAFADPTTSPVDHGDKYANGLTITGIGSMSIPFDPSKDLTEGETARFAFGWAVGQKEPPKPGDTMTITLPEWMLPATTNESLEDDNGYTICVVRELNTKVVCTFKDAVAGADRNNLRGNLIADLTAQGGKQSSPIQWGQEFNAYQKITGKESGTVAEPPPARGDRITETSATKNGVVASEFKYDGQTYLQVLWSVLLPKEALSETTTISDELQPLEFTDPITQERIVLPHYLPAGNIGGGTLTLMRRDKPNEEGVWVDSESLDCEPTGKYGKSNLDCAKFVAQADATGALVPRTSNVSGEAVSLSGFPGINNWEKNTKFSLTLENPKDDAAYNLVFYTWIPKHPAINLNSSYALKNKVKINAGEANGTASIKAIFYNEAFGDPAQTRVIVRKKVEGPSGVKSDVEQFDITLKPAAGGAQDCKVSTTEECYFDIPAGSAATISEDSVKGSQYQWTPGVFTLAPQQTGKNTEYEITDNGVNITRANGGEAIVFTLTNTFTAPPAAPTTGNFRVRKTVTKPAELALTKPFAFKYSCESGTGTAPIEGDFTIPVAGGEHTSDAIPAGYECAITEQTAETKSEAASKNFTHAVNEERKTVRIEAGQTLDAEFENTYTAAATGYLKISKRINGVKNTQILERVDVKLTCNRDSKSQGDSRFEANTPKIVSVPVGGQEHLAGEFYVGTRCEFEEVESSARIANHSLPVVDYLPGNQTLEIAAEPTESNTIAITNTYTPEETGTLYVAKEVQGLANTATLSEVNVAVTCDRDSASTGDKQFLAGQAKNVTVSTGALAVAVGDFYAGTSCSFDELAESARVPDHHEPQVTYAPASKSVRIQPSEQPDVNIMRITNTYTPVNFGVLKVKKTASVAGAATAELPAEIPANVTVKLRCDKPSRAGKYAANTDFDVEVPQNGAEVSVDEGFAHGTSCEYVSEEGAEHANYQLATQASQAVTIGADADANRITVTNTYTPKTNTFAVVKNVQKPDALNLTKPFRFTYTCNGSGGEETGELEIPVAGGRVESKPFAVGTECTITEQVDETAAEAKAANHIHQVNQQSQQVTIEVNQKVEAAFTNTYREEEKGTLFVNKSVDGLVGGAELDSVTVAVTCDRDSVSTGEKAFAKDVAKTIEVSTKSAAVEVGEFFVGTQCQFEEVADSAKVPNHHDPVVTYAPESKTVQIQASNLPSDNIMRITNTYREEEKGTLYVNKAVAGLAPGAELDSVTVAVTCDRDSVSTGEKALSKDVVKNIQVSPKAAAVNVGEFYAGTQCRFEEVADSANVDNHAAPAVTYNPASQIVSVQPGDQPDRNRMEITNTYTENPKGVLFVKKDAVGVAQGVTAPTVTVDISCNAPLVGETAALKRTVQLVPGAEATRVGEFYAGAACTVVEQADTAQLAEHEGPVVSYEPAGGAITIKPGATAQENLVTVTNNYTEVLFGALRIKKNTTVAGIEGAQVPQSAQATVTAKVTCDRDSRKGKYVRNRAFDVPVEQNGPVVVVDEEFEHGTVCSVSEEIGAEAQAYTPKVSIDRAVTIGADEAQNLITISNTYEPQQGSFTVIKRVDDVAGALPAGTSFHFDYTCVHPQFAELNKSGTLTIQGAGQAVVDGLSQGMTCTVVEKDAGIDHVEWKVTADQQDAQITVADGQPATITFTNTYTVPTGGLSVTKKVVREDAEGLGASIAIDPNKEFTFTYTCELPGAQGAGTRANLGEPSRGELKVKAGGTESVTRIVAGSSCLVQEVAESAQVDNATVTLPRPQRVDVDKRGLSTLSMTNTYAATTGSITVHKQLEGSAKDLQQVRDHAFNMNVHCTKEAWKLNKALKVSATTPVTVTDIPAGAQCAVTEELAGIQIAGVRVDTDPAAVTNVPVAPVVAGQATDVTVRNVVTELGRVQIVKTLAGLSAGQGEALEFQVSATWQDKNEHKEHVLRLKANQPVVLPDVPVGTVVKLVEAKPADTAFAVWKDPEFILGETSVNDADGAGVVTVAANTFAQPMALELRNTANPPWWWGFVALIPLAAALIPMVPQPPAAAVQAAPPAGHANPAGAAGAAENDRNAAVRAQAKGQAKQAAGEPQLAATGADVRLLSVLALLLVTSGAVLALRRRNS
ncbi:MAG: DUF5979 domain-containing protein [Corynebacterium sp.]|uniref:DUF5979 domain-containing protein n=1 Tax=Corynebacterium sp. TaxID=1720 RepID=UPI0026DCED9B|nr:DUF5979 domain-containing protein [Corynebacterium sp.]MDO4761667.1 DUF5979 domain-containing protein [Corynebacterium sp.]